MTQYVVSQVSRPPMAPSSEAPRRVMLVGACWAATATLTFTFTFRRFYPSPAFYTVGGARGQYGASLSRCSTIIRPHPGMCTRYTTSMIRILASPHQWLRSLGDTPLVRIGQNTHMLSPAAKACPRQWVSWSLFCLSLTVLVEHPHAVHQPAVVVQLRAPSNLRLRRGPGHQAHMC